MPIALSALAGFVDALGVLALGGYYVSFMSGNSTLLGVGLAANAGSRWLLAGGLVLSFTAGVVLGMLVGRQFPRRRPPVVLLAVAGLLAAAAALHGNGSEGGGALLMAVAMGVENTVFAREGAAPIGLTYMTGTLVRFGQHLAEALVGGPWAALVPDLLLWSGMVAGAVAGALMFKAAGLDGLWLAVAAALLLAAVAWPRTEPARRR